MNLVTVLLYGTNLCNRVYNILLSGVVTALDESVGRVLKVLKKAEMLENSIIVFMSDNGAQTIGFLENFGSNYPLRGVINFLNTKSYMFCFCHITI